MCWMYPQYWVHPQCWEHLLVLGAFSDAGYVLSAGCTRGALSIPSAGSIPWCWMYPLMLSRPMTLLLSALRLQHAVWLCDPGAACPAGPTCHSVLVLCGGEAAPRPAATRYASCIMHGARSSGECDAPRAVRPAPRCADTPQPGPHPTPVCTRDAFAPRGCTHKRWAFALSSRYSVLLCYFPFILP